MARAIGISTERRFYILDKDSELFCVQSKFSFLHRFAAVEHVGGPEKINTVGFLQVNVEESKPK